MPKAEAIPGETLLLRNNCARVAKGAWPMTSLHYLLELQRDWGTAAG
jgi:hypothetical protein